MRVLAIMCHPDDMELTCSGTLLKYKAQGHEVIACHAANGNMGHYEIMPDELRTMRAKEAKNAADMGGFKIISADIDDLTINSSSEEQLKKIIAVIRFAKPDVIITHNPKDYCSDHNELSKLVFKASFDATCPHFMPELGEPADLTPLYYADTDLGLGNNPTEYVDITDYLETKEEMLRCHESQLTWLKEHDGIDVVMQLRNVAQFRGQQCGVAYAEAFTQELTSGRIRPYRVLP